MNSFALADCTTVNAALSQLKDGAVIKAGGIDLLERMKNGTIQPSKLVNIRNISSLRGIHETENGLTIGALTTLAEISEHPQIRAQYQILSDACGHAATPNIRNGATFLPPSWASCLLRRRPGLICGPFFSKAVTVRSRI